MRPLENLHYALGELAYVIARADGSVQKEERERFHDLVKNAMEANDHDFDISDIIFKLMDKARHQYDSKVTYEWAINEIKTNSHYLSPSLKATFIRVMEKIAEAYPPVTIEEKNIIEKFKEDIGPISGDPVYYESK